VSSADINEKPPHSILLGGLGGDSHSVGLTILRLGLAGGGYRVHYLGTQNRLEDFFELAGLHNIVMISSMDGHARYYLRNFHDLLKQYQPSGTLWYLGGNLHIGDGYGCEREFLEMGFDRLFIKFVDIKSVLEILKRDLSGIAPSQHYPALSKTSKSPDVLFARRTLDVCVEPDIFERAREEVLEHWKTGHAAKSLEKNAEFLSRQPSFAKVQALVNSTLCMPLIQPRSGVALLDEQIKLFKTFKGAGAQVLSYQIDSLTRNNNYAGAEWAIRESRASGISTINGFPLINHGVTGLRRIAREVNIPLQTRHSTRDPRLLAEMSYAGGVTSFEGGCICYNIPYYKNYTLDESIANWQYVDYLTGLYNKRFGIVLDREIFGTLTACLIPPCLAIIVNLIETLLALRQGVKCVSLGYAEQGHRAQDIAAIRTLRKMANDILYNLGYKDVQVNTVFHQYMAAFPKDPERAANLIYNSAITAALSGATRLIVKTPAEAHMIPPMEANIHGIELARRGLADAAQVQPDETQIAAESDLIQREVEDLFRSVIACGNGDVAQGVITSFQKGFLDIPFSPSVYNRGEVVTARDTEGAVRFASTGNLQFRRELIQFHRHKIEERRRAEGLLFTKDNYLLVELDVLQIAREDYVAWPLSS
jgi:methylaspartate mutase epsilon subunit